MSAPRSVEFRGGTNVARNVPPERCDEMEPLTDGFRGFWIKNPPAIVHLVAEPDEAG